MSNDLRDKVMSDLLDEKDRKALLEIAAKLRPDVWARIKSILDEPEEADSSSSPRG